MRRERTRVSAIWRPNLSTACPRPLFTARVSAGFPSPADDHLDGLLDLNEYCVRHPSATFFLRVAGDSMTGAGIYSGDLLVVDRAREPLDGSIVIAVLDSELTVKRLRLVEHEVFLEPDNPDYPKLKISSDCELEIWGVVTHVVHAV